MRPISIGLAAEDGRTYYAEFEGAREAASQTEWLRQNVLPHLVGPEIPASEIAEQIREFVGVERPEFLAAYGAYDWVILCQSFGGLITEINGQHVVVLDIAGNKHSLARTDVKTMQASHISLMPEGLLDAMTEQQVKDLFAYFMSGAPVGTGKK